MASSLVGMLRVILTADSAEFKSGLGEAGRAATQFSGQMSGITTQVGSFGKTIGTLFTVGAITSAIVKVSDYASQIQDLAQQTGLTTQTIQEMAHAAKQTGSSLESFTNAAFKLGTNLADGTNKVIGATEALGLSYDALRQMSPDEQFMAIATALGNVEDAQKRNELGVILMGKSYKSVASSISEGYAELARAAGIAGQEQIEALEAAGDELDAFKSKLMVVGVTVVGSFAKAMNQLATALKQDFDLIKSHTFDRWQETFENWGTIFGKAAQGPKVMSAAMKDLPAPLRAVSMSMEEQERAAKSLDAQVAKSIETNKAAKDAAEDFAKSLRAIGGADAIAGAQEVVRQLGAIGGPLKVLPSEMKALATQLTAGAEAALMLGNVRLGEQFEQLSRTLNPLIMFQQRYNVTIGEYVTDANSAANATEAMWEQVHRLSGELVTIGPLLESTFNVKGLMNNSMFTGFKTAVTQNLPDLNEWAEAWSGMKEGLQQTLGNIPQTLANAFTGGGDILGAVKSIASQIGSTIGGAIGSAFGPLGTQIGAALGSMAGSLVGGFKKLFGIGVNEEVKKANAEIGKLRDNLINTHGPLDVLEQKAQAVGLSFAEAWGHQGQAGLEQFTRLIEEFERRWEQLQEKRAELESELSDTRGEFDSLIGKARELGYEFSQTGEFVGVNFEAMRQKAQEFGVDLNGLGPAFRQQALDAEASKIINAFTLMQKAGGDVGGILVGMKDEIGKVVGDSLKFGTTVPANMQPWIAELIRTGQLVDENGNAITDLSLIKFGDPVATEFEKIATALGEVVDKLSALLDQIAAIPTQKTFTVQAQYNDPGPPPGFGDPNQEPRDPGFAVGTMGRTGSWFKDFGSSFNTALHHVQAVVTPQQAPAFAMDVLSGLSGGAPAAAGNGDLVEAVGRLERTLLTTIPTMVADAARHGAQTSGRRR